MTEVGSRELGDLVSFLAACSGTIAAILLAFPLFHLLRAREAIEDLERNLEAAKQTDGAIPEIRASLHDLRLHVRQRRRIAFRVGVIGVILLGMTAALLLVQAILVYL